MQEYRHWHFARLSAAGRRAVTYCQEKNTLTYLQRENVTFVEPHITCGPQTARTIQSIALMHGCPSTDGLSTSTIHDNQPAEAGNRHCMEQTIAAFYLSRHWSVASAAWVGRPAARRTNRTFWCKNCSMWVTLDNNWDNKHVVPFFRQCCLEWTDWLMNLNACHAMHTSPWLLNRESRWCNVKWDAGTEFMTCLWRHGQTQQRSHALVYRQFVTRRPPVCTAARKNADFLCSN